MQVNKELFLEDLKSIREYDINVFHNAIDTEEEIRFRAYVGFLDTLIDEIESGKYDI